MKNTNSITALSLSGLVIARSAAQSEFEGLTSALQSNPKLGSTVPKNIVLDCATDFQEAFHPPSEWSFSLFLSFDRGRFGCRFVTLGGAVQGPYEL